MIEYIDLDSLAGNKKKYHILYVSYSRNRAIVKEKKSHIYNGIYSHPIKCEWCSRPWIYFNQCNICRKYIQHVCGIHREMNYCIICVEKVREKNLKKT